MALCLWGSSGVKLESKMNYELASFRHCISVENHPDATLVVFLAISTMHPPNNNSKCSRWAILSDFIYMETQTDHQTVSYKRGHSSNLCWRKKEKSLYRIKLQNSSAESIEYVIKKEPYIYLVYHQDTTDIFQACRSMRNLIAAWKNTQPLQ